MVKCKHCGKRIWFWQNKKTFLSEDYPEKINGKIEFPMKDYSAHSFCHYEEWIKHISNAEWMNQLGDKNGFS